MFFLSHRNHRNHRNHRLANGLIIYILTIKQAETQSDSLSTAFIWLFRPDNQLFLQGNVISII